MSSLQVTDWSDVIGWAMRATRSQKSKLPFSNPGNSNRVISERPRRMSVGGRRACNSPSSDVHTNRLPAHLNLIIEGSLPQTLKPKGYWNL